MKRLQHTMKRLLLCGIAGSATMLAFAAGRRLASTLLPRLMERMMEGRFMPRMMDACFAQMTPERRLFMLEHCRNLLGQVEARYVTSKRTQSPAGGRSATAACLPAVKGWDPEPHSPSQITVRP